MISPVPSIPAIAARVAFRPRARRSAAWGHRRRFSGADAWRMLRPSEARSFAITSRIAVSLLLIAFVGAARAGTEDEVKAAFAKFVAAQNAHDIRCSSQHLIGQTVSLG